MANPKTAKKHAVQARKEAAHTEAPSTVTPLHGQARGEDYHEVTGDGRGNCVARERETVTEHGTQVSR